MPQPFVVTPRGDASGASAPPASDSASSAARVRPERSRSLSSLPEPLRSQAADPEVTDIFVHGTRGLFVDRGAGAAPVPGWRPDEDEVRDLAVALVALGGRHIDDAKP